MDSSNVHTDKTAVSACIQVNFLTELRIQCSVLYQIMESR